MFGSRKKASRIVGAKEKIMTAQMLRQAQLVEKVKTQREGGEAGPSAMLAVICGFSLLLSYFLTEGPLKDNAGIDIVGDHDIDKLLSGPGIPSFTGESDWDFLITLFGRALIIVLLAGLVPFLTWSWQQLIDSARMRPYIGVWAMGVALPTVGFLFSEVVLPALGGAVAAAM